MERAEITALFDKYIKKLRITPSWDVRLELVEDPSWRKTGDFKIDCDDRKAILMLNVVNPTQAGKHGGSHCPRVDAYKNVSARSGHGIAHYKLL